MQLVSSGRRVELFRGFEQKKDSASGLKLAENLASACLEGGGGGVAWLAGPGQILTVFLDSGLATVITLCKEREMPDSAVRRYVHEFLVGEHERGVKVRKIENLFCGLTEKNGYNTEMSEL